MSGLQLANDQDLLLLAPITASWIKSTAASLSIDPEHAKEAKIALLRVCGHSFFAAIDNSRTVAQFMFSALDGLSQDHQRHVSNCIRLAKLRLEIIRGVLIAPMETNKASGSECAQDNWHPGIKVDYFHCHTCSVRWICNFCNTSCHSDHQTFPFIKEHEPDKPYCQCRKKSKCQSSTTSNPVIEVDIKERRRI